MNKNNLNKNLLTANQIVGLTDAEGLFFVKFYPKKENNNFTLVIEFKISQMIYSLDLLKRLQEYFKCGKIVIDNRKTGTLKYSVRNIEDIINIIIPFFDKNILLTSKYLDYLAFRKAILLAYENKNNLNQNIIDKINNLIIDSNSNRKDEDIFKFCLNHCKINKITPGWIAGFLEGDGTFQFYIGSSSMYPSIEIAQHKSHRPLLNLIKSYFEGGSVKPNVINDTEFINVDSSKRNIHRYVLNGINLITSKVIPLLDNFTFYSVKNLDYNDWKLLISKYQKEDHFTNKGKEEMIKIKKGMNNGRKIRSEWKNIEWDKIEINSNNS